MSNKIVVICIIENLRFQENTSFEFFDRTFTNDPEVLFKNIPYPQIFLERIGIINFQSLSQSVVSIKTYDNIENVVGLEHRESGFLNQILQLYWFDQDNSIFVCKTFSQRFNDDYVTFNVRDNFFSNSSGKYEISHFNNSNFARLLGIAESYFELLIKTGEDNTKEIPYKKGFFNQSDTASDYGGLTRLQRAFFLLTSSRKESNLIVRIASYITTLECLLLNDNQELSFRLKIYAANFVGDDKHRKHDISKLVGKGYNLRSKFLHGDKVSITMDDLAILSNEMDNLLREVFKKALSMEDIFNKKNKEPMNNYFSSLLFN